MSKHGQSRIGPHTCTSINIYTTVEGSCMYIRINTHLEVRLLGMHPLPTCWYMITVHLIYNGLIIKAEGINCV